MEDIKIKVSNFLNRFFRKRELLEDEDMFVLGFVNSLFAMQLVMFIEKEFAIRIDNKDMDLNNFKTINSIERLIKNKLHEMEHEE